MIDPQQLQNHATQLVEQLKQGLITKEQLIQRLQQPQSINQTQSQTQLQQQQSNQDQQQYVSQNYPLLQSERVLRPSYPELLDQENGLKRSVNGQTIQGQSQFHISESESKIQNPLKNIENRMQLHQQNLEISQKERKAYNLPLQFTDKFFDEDPGLIKLDGIYTSYRSNNNTNNQNQQQTMTTNIFNQLEANNNSYDSIEFISGQLNMLAIEKENSNKPPEPTRHQTQNCGVQQQNQDRLKRENGSQNTLKIEKIEDGNRADILRRASELTKAIDSQYSLERSQQDQKYMQAIRQQQQYTNVSSQHQSQFTSQVASQVNLLNHQQQQQPYTTIFTSPIPTSSIINENRLSTEVVVHASDAISDQMQYFGNTLPSYRSNYNPVSSYIHKDGEFEQPPMTSTLTNSNYNNAFKPKNLFTTDYQANNLSANYINNNELLQNQHYPINSNNTTSNNGYEIHNESKSFQERNSKWSNQQNYKKHLIQQQLDESKLKECTFKPQTNASSAKMIGYKRHSDSQGPTRHHQLYEQNGKKVQEIQMKYHKDEEEKLKQTCTFKPHVNDNEYAVVSSKYLNIAEELINNKISMNDLLLNGKTLQTTEESQLRNCTFHPHINAIKKSMQTAQLYTSINPFDRLSKPLNQLLPSQNNEVDFRSQIPGGTYATYGGDQHDYMSNQDDVIVSGRVADLVSQIGGGICPISEDPEMAKLNEQLQTFGQNSLIQQQMQESLSALHGTRNQLYSGNLSEIQSIGNFASNKTSISLQQFNDRQLKFLQDKEEKIKKLEQELYPSEHKPQMCDRSKAMIGSNGGESDTNDFHRRNQLLLEKQFKIRNEDMSLEYKDCTFQPQITKLAKQQRSKASEELCYGDLLRKQKAIDNVQYQMEADLRSQATFVPQLIAFDKNQDMAQIKSKLAIREDLDQLIDKIQADNERKKQETNEIKRLREEMEQIECTYHPQTTELPDYIKKIADESRKIKEERCMIASQLPPQKPEWKS